MCCDPLTPIPVPEHPTPHSRVQELLHPRSVRREKREVQLQQFSHLNSDPEKQGRADVVSKRSGLDLNHYRIVNEVWHFMSVDWGYRCKLPSRVIFCGIYIELADGLKIPVSATTPYIM